VGVNFWFEDVIDAYLRACSEGRDWQADCVAKAEVDDKPRRVLTRKALKSKGITYSRQHIARLIRRGAFPRPFQLPNNAAS
jgi:hypothetical protein